MVRSTIAPRSAIFTVAYHSFTFRTASRSSGFYLGSRSGTTCPFIHSCSPFRCPLCRLSSDKLLTRPAPDGPQRYKAPARRFHCLRRGGWCPSVSRGGVPSRLRGGATLPPWPCPASGRGGWCACGRWWRPVVLVSRLLKSAAVSRPNLAARGAARGRVPFSPLVSLRPPWCLRRLWRLRRVRPRRLWRWWWRVVLVSRFRVSPCGTWRAVSVVLVSVAARPARPVHL